MAGCRTGSSTSRRSWTTWSRLFARLPVTASMQPTHCTEYTAADQSDNWSVRLGPTRARRGWRIRDLREAGVRVALGSDWPIADFDPRGILAAAQLRRRGGARDRAPIQPDQAISARMALEGYTTHAAWSVGEQEDTGSLEVGKRADLTAFAADPLVVPPDELVDAPIVLTVADGAITHEALVGATWS
jgi:predicted amidohydrolase YtcJ